MSRPLDATTTFGFYRFVSPEDVRKFRAWLGPLIASLDENLPPELPADIRAGWRAFVERWAKACAKEPSWEGSSEQLDEGEAFARTFDAWRVSIARYADSMTVGSLLGRVVTPDDTKALKDRVNATVIALDAVVNTCPKLPEATRVGWNAFSQAWRKFFESENSWWHAGAQMDHGEACERDVANWRDTIALFKCDGLPPAPSPMTPSVFKDVDTTQIQNTVSTVFVAGAVIAVAATAALILGPLTKKAR